VPPLPEIHPLADFITSTNGTCDEKYAMLARLVPIAERSFSGSTGSDGTAGEVTEFEVPGGVDGVGVVGDGVVLPEGAGVVGDGVVLLDGAGVVGDGGVVVDGALFCPGGAFPAGFVFPAGVAVIPGVVLLEEPFGASFDTWVLSSESAP